MMRDYILYHNATKMGYDLEENPIISNDEIAEALEEGMNIFKASAFYEKESYEPDWEFFVGNDDLEELAFSIVTSNRKETRESIGQRVWIIQGEAMSAPRQYYFHGFFVPLVADRGLTEVGGKEFKYRLWGQDENLVRPISSAIHIPREGWFSEVLRRFQFFRFGFREITNSAWTTHLEELQEELLRVQEKD